MARPKMATSMVATMRGAAHLGEVVGSALLNRLRAMAAKGERSPASAAFTGVATEEATKQRPHAVATRFAAARTTALPVVSIGAGNVWRNRPQPTEYQTTAMVR